MRYNPDLTSPARLPFGARAVRLGGGYVLAIGWVLAASALGQRAGTGAEPQGRQPLSVTASDGQYTFDFARDEQGVEPSLFEVLEAAAGASDQLFLMDESTEVLLRHRRVRLLGKKVVPQAELNSFLKTLLVISDAEMREVSGDGLTLLKVEPLPKEPAPDTGKATGESADQIISATSAGYFISLAPPSTDDRVELLEFLGAMATASDLAMTWSEGTEALLRDAYAPRALELWVPTEELDSFFTAIMAVAGFQCTQVGSEDISVMKVEPASVADRPRAAIAAGPEDQIQVGSSRDQGPARCNLYELVQLTSLLAQKSFTWAAATEAQLMKENVRLVGAKILARNKLLPLAQRILEAAGYRCEEIGEPEVSVIKIEPR